MDVGTAYSATVSPPKSAQPLVQVDGTLASLDAAGQKFAHFVVDRPHKFLAQVPSKKESNDASTANGARRLVFASWREGMFTCTSDGCMRVDPSNPIDPRPIMRRTFGDDCNELESAWYVPQHR